MKQEKTRSGKKGLTTPRKIIIIICSVLVAAAIAAVVFYFIQAGEARRLNEDTAARYLISIDGQKTAGEGDSSGAGDDSSFSVDWEGLWSVNPDVCAWIQIPAIPDISYPVIHYTDNDYYLRRSWQGDYLVSGCIMEDYLCSPDFTDLHTILYGHNMDTGTMFGQLKKFQDQSFYDSENDTVNIYLPERILVYTIFSVHAIYPSDPGIYVVNFERGDSFDDFVAGLKSMSEFDTGVEVDGKDTILTLSTCSGTGATKRLVVHAKLTAEVSS